MKQMIIAFLIGICSLSAFANSNGKIRNLAEKPFSTSEDVDNFMSQLPSLTSRVDLQGLSVLVSEVAKLDGENQFG